MTKLLKAAIAVAGLAILLVAGGAGPESPAPAQAQGTPTMGTIVLAFGPGVS